MGAVGFSLQLTTQFRGTSRRQGLLIKGPAGWGEFAPFPEYDDDESARWLAAAIEAAWLGWPSPERTTIAVNAIVPAVSPEVASRIKNMNPAGQAPKPDVADRTVDFPGEFLIRHGAEQCLVL